MTTRNAKPQPEIVKTLENLENQTALLSLEVQLEELGRQRERGQINRGEHETQLRELLAGLRRLRAQGRLGQRDYSARRDLLLGPRGLASLAPKRQEAAPPVKQTVAPPPPPRPLPKRLSEDWLSWGAAPNGARVVVTRAQQCVFVLLIVLGPVLLFVRARAALIVGIGAVTALYLAVAVYKAWLMVRAERAGGAVGLEPEPASGDDLPVYTVLVPLHHEAGILPLLVDRLNEIDYPTDRLEILLLVELDDEETQSAARNYPLPPHIRTLIMPPGQPRTKPRALNIGLHESHGEYLVIYDAEDLPERDQLRKAVSAFRELPPEVVCLQARLNFYNRHQTLLTKLFSVDYALWYDQLLRGLTHTKHLQSGSFVPLGGTSNHFRVDVLRKVGGWDPFNVTEDCDLGVRLGRDGLRVGMLDSVTWEEAVPHVKPWIKQRSRWAKGYLQTYLVHMRSPRLLWKQLGPRGFTDFQMLVGVSSFALLINPIMWILTAAYAVSKGTQIGGAIESLFPAALYYSALLSLLAGNFILFYCNAYVCVRRNYIELTRYTVLTPIYWMLMSIGAWAGLLSLIRRPFYWAKTEHGVSVQESKTEGPPALAA